MNNKINFYIENKTIKVDIQGNWLDFVLPVKDKIKLRRYSWNKDKKIWTKELNDIRIKDQLKEEYDFFRNNFKSEYLNFGNLKDCVIKLNEEQDNHKDKVYKETFSDIENLPLEIFNKLLPHQIEGIRRFNLQYNKILLAFPMGCLCEDTIVTANVRGSSFKITLKKLYDLWTIPRKKWNSKKYKRINYNTETKIRSYNEKTECFELYDLENVIYSGKKDTINLFFNNGHNLICTKDHKIFTDRGWVEADNLTFDDNIYSNGEILKCQICGSEKNIRHFKRTSKNICNMCYLKEKIVNWEWYAKDPKQDYVCIKWCIVKFHPNCPKEPNGMAKHRLIYEAYINNISYDKWLEKIINNDFNENDKFLNKKSVIHHKDEDKSNNDISNLEYFEDNIEHNKYHSVHNIVKKHFKIMVPKKTKLIKKEYYGIVDTYDLTIKDSHCFVANNILVHNCGKSFSSLAIAKSKNKKMIIIVPKSLIDPPQWKEEILKWKICDEHKIYNSEDDLKHFHDGYDIYIFNYEKFRFLSKDKIEQYTEKEKKLYNFLMKIDPENFIIILDELYKIKNYKSMLYKAYHKLTTNWKWFGVVGLSGTPQENSIFEFYTILNFIQWNIITWHEMEKHFIYRDPFKGIVFKNLNYFNSLANKLMFRIKKEDVKSNLPKLTQTYRFVNHNKKANEVTSKLLENSDFFSCYSTLRVLDSYFKPNEELKQYEILKDYPEIIHESKLEELYDILEEIGEEKVLIFTAYSKTMYFLVNELKNTYIVKGVDASTKDKDKIKYEFENGNVQIVIATETWSRGVNLPHINYLINFDFPLNPAIYEQRRDRIHRLNSTEPKQVISLISDIIEKDIFDLVKSKIESLEQTVDGVSEENVLQTIADKWGMELKQKKTKNEK